MSDEEKQAIKDCDSIFICLDDAMSEDSANYYRKSYKILKNLIEKKSKEIEEYKILSNAGIYQLGFNDGIKSVENKIKAKIEDILNSENSEAIEKLIEWHSLLEKE